MVTVSLSPACGLWSIINPRSKAPLITIIIVSKHSSCGDLIHHIEKAALVWPFASFLAAAFNGLPRIPPSANPTSFYFPGGPCHKPTDWGPFLVISISEERTPWTNLVPTPWQIVIQRVFQYFFFFFLFFTVKYRYVAHESTSPFQGVFLQPSLPPGPALRLRLCLESFHWDTNSKTTGYKVRGPLWVQKKSIEYNVSPVLLVQWHTNI